MNDNAASALYALHRADEPLTTTEIAKRVFDPETDTELRNADRKVRRYVEETCPHLVVQGEREDGTKLFALSETDVWFGAGKVTVISPPDEVEIGLGSVMVYVDEAGDPQVMDLEQEVSEEEAGEPESL